MGLARPNIILPDTAHLTFDRARWYLGMEARRVPVAADRRADVAAMAAAMDAKTVALIGSAPNYPFGGIDRIAELGALAMERGVWLHVDACVGGFLSPFPVTAWAGAAGLGFRRAGRYLHQRRYPQARHGAQGGALATRCCAMPR